MVIDGILSQARLAFFLTKKQQKVKAVNILSLKISMHRPLTMRATRLLGAWRFSFTALEPHSLIALTAIPHVLF